MTYPLNLQILPPCPPTPLSRFVLNASPRLNRTSIIATTPPPLMERISCYLRHSLQGNIISASSEDIYLYLIDSSGEEI